MAIIDYDHIHSGSYAALSLPAKALIPVLATLCDNFTGAIPRKHSKAHILSKFSGISTRAVPDALEDLESAGIVSLDRKKGRAPSIQYIPVVRISKQTSAPGAEVGTPTSAPGAEVTPLCHPPETPPEPTDNQPPQERQDPCSSLTTVLKNNNGSVLSYEDSAAGKVKPPIIPSMKKRYGHEFVDEILEQMSHLGDEIEKPTAFFMWCCKTGVIPDTERAREELRKEKAMREAEEREEHARRAWNEHAARVRKEQADPETMARVQAIQEEFMASNQALPLL